MEGCILIRISKNINSGGLIGSIVRSLIITDNTNKKEGMERIIKIGKLSGAAARTGNLKIIVIMKNRYKEARGFIKKIKKQRNYRRINKNA